MGSGGMIVMDEKTCMVDMAKYFLNFLRDESCGKCVSCREGTQRMWEIVSRIAEGKGREEDIGILEDLAVACRDASMCGLGQTAANPVLSTLRYFKDEYRQHIRRKKCPALVCKEIVSSPCQYVCPIDQEASTYIALVASGKYEEAFRVIMKDNPLPSVCARVCHHPCELACRAGESGEPISIRGLKRFVTDWAEKNGIHYVPERVEPEPGKSRHHRRRARPVSRPATFWPGKDSGRRSSRPYPSRAACWPSESPIIVCPGPLVQKEIELIKDSGVEIRLNKILGRDITIDGLFKSGYKAVYCATGAGQVPEHGNPRRRRRGRPPFPGIPAPGEPRKQSDPSANGCASSEAEIPPSTPPGSPSGTPICEQVTIFYRRTKAEMPAMAEDVEAAIEEGVDIQLPRHAGQGPDELRQGDRRRMHPDEAREKWTPAAGRSRCRSRGRISSTSSTP